MQNDQSVDDRDRHDRDGTYRSVWQDGAIRLHENGVLPPSSRASRKIDVAALSAMLGTLLLQSKRLSPRRRPRPLLMSLAIVVAVGAPGLASPKTSKQQVSGVYCTKVYNRDSNRLCACQRPGSSNVLGVILLQYNSRTGSGTFSGCFLAHIHTQLRL